MNLKLAPECSIKNHYHLELIDVNSGELKQVVDCHNLVTNLPYTALLQGSWFATDGISLGTGSETPNVTDLNLPNKIWTGEAVSIVTQTYPTAKRVMTVTVPADSAIGQLTRCGIDNSDTRYVDELATHALFVDSEGNPIVINKTNTDILKITVTLYYTFNITAPSNPEIFVCNNATNVVYQSLIGIDNLFGWAKGIQYLMYKADKYTENPYGPVYLQSIMPAPMVDGVASTGDCEQNYSIDNQWHAGLGYEIKAVTLIGIGTFNITAANFPPRLIGRYDIGIGDGINKDFNIKTPSAVPGTQVVRVDGVVKIAGVDYTFYPFNMVDFYTNYPSANKSKATYEVELVGANDSYGGPFYPRVTGGGGWENERVIITATKPITYDFGQAITVNCFYGPLDTLAFMEGAQVEYSTDGINWSLFMQITAAMINPVDVKYIHTRAQVVARYWRYTAPDENPRYIQNRETEEPIFCFGNYSPSVKFVVAPPVNSVVDIDYNIAYPFKNSMHSVSMNIGIEIGR